MRRTQPPTWRNARADLPPPDDGAALRRRLESAADLHLAAGDVDRARGTLQRLVDVSEASVERSVALARLAHLLLVQAEWVEAARLYREAASLVDHEPAHRIPIELGLAGVGVPNVAGPTGWRAARRRSVAPCRGPGRSGPPVPDPRACRVMARRGCGDWRELMERADRLAPMVGEVVAGAEHPDLQFVRLLRDAGEFDEARRRIERLDDTAAERGDRHSLPRFLANRAGVLARTGELHQAERTLDEATTGVLLTGEGAWMDNAIVLSHRIAVTRGNTQRPGARRANAPARGREPAPHALTLVDGSRDSRARLRWWRHRCGGRPTRSAARHCIAKIPNKAAFICQVAVLAIEVAVARGRLDAARSIADTHLERLRSTGVRCIRAETDRAGAVRLAADGDTDSARAMSDEAIASAATTGMPTIHARSLLSAGEIRRRARQKAQARDALTEAIAIFERLRPRLWLERALHRSSTASRRSGRGRPAGQATEREVIDSVAAGRMNKEIADALFMSVHTVEAYLTRLFLRLASRAGPSSRAWRSKGFASPARGEPARTLHASRPQRHTNRDFPGFRWGSSWSRRCHGRPDGQPNDHHPYRYQETRTMAQLAGATRRPSVKPHRLLCPGRLAPRRHRRWGVHAVPASIGAGADQETAGAAERAKWLKYGEDWERRYRQMYPIIEQSCDQRGRAERPPGPGERPPGPDDEPGGRPEHERDPRGSPAERREDHRKETADQRHRLGRGLRPVWQRRRFRVHRSPFAPVPVVPAAEADLADRVEQPDRQRQPEEDRTELPSVSAAPRPSASRRALTTVPNAVTGAETISWPGIRSHTATRRFPAVDRRRIADDLQEEQHRGRPYRRDGAQPAPRRERRHPLPPPDDPTRAVGPIAKEAGCAGVTDWRVDVADERG